MRFVTTTACATATALTSTRRGAATIAARIASIAAVTPEAGDAAEDRAALTAGLAVVVAAAITRIALVGGMIDPGIDVQLATAAAVVALATATTPGDRAAAAGSAGHRPATTCENRREPERKNQ